MRTRIRQSVIYCDYFQRRYLFISRLRKLLFIKTKLRKNINGFEQNYGWFHLPQSVVFNAFSVLGIPTGDTQNTRDLGTGVPKTRGYPNHCDSGLYSTFDVCCVAYDVCMYDVCMLRSIRNVKLLKCVSLICLSPLFVFYSSLNCDGPRTKAFIILVLFNFAEILIR